MSELATGYVQILPSMKGVRGMIQEELGDSGEQSGKKAGSLFGSTMKKYISAAAIGTAVFSSISEGGKLEQSLGGIATLYGDHADTVIKYADEAWRNAGISANSYMEQSTSFAAALINSLGGDTAKAAEAANTAIQDMADNSAKMGSPIESLQLAYQGFARGQYQLLDNLKLGYGGTKTEMEKLLVDAKKFSGVKYDINNLSDVYEAIHVIQNEMGLTGVAADEAKTTLEGSFNSMKASLTNLMGDLSLGRNIEPAMRALIESTSNYLFGNLIPAIGNVFKSLPSAIGIFIQEGIPQLMTTIKDLLSSLADSFKNSDSIITSALDGILDLSKYILDNAGEIVDAGISIVTYLANGLINSMPKIIETVPQIITNISNIINNNAPKLLTAGIGIVVALIKGMIQSIPLIIKNLPQIFEAVLSAWTAFGWVSLGKSAVKGMTNAFTSVKGTIKGKLSGLKETITKPFTNAKDSIKKLVDKIKGFFPLNVGKIMTNLKVPKIHVSGGKAPYGIGGGTPPSVSIKWNAEGGIFDSASIIGYGVGEKGAEAILPLDEFWRKMDRIAESVNGGTAGTVEIYLDGSVIAKSTVNYINGQVQRYGTSPLTV